MKIVVHEARVDSDRGLILETLHRFLTSHLTTESNAARFAWLYERNPHGSPRAWVARDANRGEVIGLGSAFPRYLCHPEGRELAWVLGDFCIHPDYRTLGPAIQLQRVFLEEAGAGRLAFWYDFPSQAMVAVYRRLGLAPTHQLTRFAQILRYDRKLAPLLRSRRLAAILATPVNWMARMSAGHGAGRYEIEILRGACGPEFTELSREVQGTFGLFSERTAEYLNWRYADPLRRYELATAKLEGRLRGWAAYHLSDADAQIVDLVAPDEAVMRTLIRTLTRRFLGSGVGTVSVPLLSTHVWVPSLRGLGFHPRESSPVITGGHQGSAALAHLARGGSWFLWNGDRDN